MQIPDFVVPRLNTSSALGQALISMFRAIEMELTLEGASPGAVQVIVFGGCAVHLYTHHRVSTDVDAEIYCANTQDTLRLRTLLAEFPEQFFDEQSGRVMELNYDLQYNTSFGPVLSSALDTLVKSPLNQADDAALVSAAKAVWYSDTNLVGEVRAFMQEHSSEVELRRAGYLLERFTRFSCATDSRVKEALKALELFSASRQYVKSQGAVALRSRRDELAMSWGLSEGLGLKVQTLMPFQTRHYEAEQRAASA